MLTTNGILDSLVPTLHCIKVEPANYTLQTQMFPKPGETSKKSFKWEHFISAMIDADFSAQQGTNPSHLVRLYTGDTDNTTGNGGSAMRFRSNDGLGSISFHYPHPEGIVHPTRLNIMAKRMRKWFGWSRELFEVRVK